MNKKKLSTELKEQAKRDRSYKAYKQALETQEYERILKTAFNPDEFEKIWAKCPPIAKLSFLKDSMKYVFEEKSKKQEKPQDNNDIVASIVEQLLK